MYNEKVIKEFSDPQNVGELKNPNGVGTVGNASCGDIMKLFLRIENDIIVDVSFKTFGCAAAIATASTATRLIKGVTIEDALKVTNQHVVDELGGLPSQKLHCSVLAHEAIVAAIEDYKNNKINDK
ncbi:MAG: iron-sulfur cluster assembly scaffold protein [Firmicutes bacterium]|nr:iron-sulfur cluster assembly scaffold protein [Bacillota bacterium]